MYCKCDCGNEKAIIRGSLLSGLTQSCGCLHKELTIKANTKHGHAKRSKFSPEYYSWASMWTRTTNPKCAAYKHYGGRGIRVCDEWKSFDVFFQQMGPRPKGTTLERKNNELGYFYLNCVWAGRIQQSRNKRNSVILSIGLEKKHIKEWAEISGNKYDTIHSRNSRGMPAHLCVFNK